MVAAPRFTPDNCAPRVPPWENEYDTAVLQNIEWPPNFTRRGGAARDRESAKLGKDEAKWPFLKQLFFAIGLTVRGQSAKPIHNGSIQSTWFDTMTKPCSPGMFSGPVA